MYTLYAFDLEKVMMPFHRWLGWELSCELLQQLVDMLGGCPRIEAVAWV